ncbi:MAG TPA: hypothetical protein EYQ00_09645 [Dehalococcoidia bacterium]|jgi:hypothetical protein|nr:hypothetical protein [Dehalococcoidia bacterium]
MGEFSKLAASNILYNEYVKPVDEAHRDYEQNDNNYDLSNPIYRAGYRYALQQVQFKVDEMKNSCFKTAVQSQKEYKL